MLGIRKIAACIRNSHGLKLHLVFSSLSHTFNISEQKRMKLIINAKREWQCALKCENTLIVNLFVDKGRGLAGCWLGHQASAGSSQPQVHPSTHPPPAVHLRHGAQLTDSVVAGLLSREECTEGRVYVFLYIPSI